MSRDRDRRETEGVEVVDDADAGDALSGTVTDEPKGTGLAVPAEILPGNITVLPVYGRPMFPVQSMPVVLDEDPWVRSLVQMRDGGQSVAGLLMVRPGADPAPAHGAAGPKPVHPIPNTGDLCAVGTAAVIHQASAQEGKLQFVAEGRRRFRVHRWLSDVPPLVASVTYESPPHHGDDPEIKAYAMAIIGIIKKLVPLNPLYNEELKLFLDRFTPHQPAFLADFAANLTTANGDELQEVLESFDVLARMQRVLVLLQRELEMLELQASIRAEVEKTMTDQQRRFFLSEQLKIIQRELGISKDDRTAEVERFRSRLESLELTEEASGRVEEELRKLSVLETGSPEYGVTRNYLDWVTSLPWGQFTEDNLDLDRARRVLDRDHSGLGDVKDRIIEFLAVGKLREGVAGSILLLVGPPGVGKTSVGRSVAQALEREFFRFSLGGMRDEAEIKGHRRTYIGAMPGKFVQAFKAVGSSNPVVMLDEIDKVGSSYHGDPASALLEALDPEQNTDFLDHYIDLRFDLSNALFVCTANQLDTIPQPLLDRMEVIHLSGYIAAEKLAIAKHHLLPRQLARAGLTRRQAAVSDAALRRIIEGYAREAGVRNLEKQIGRVLRKVAVAVVRQGAEQVRVNVGNLEAFLGKPRFTTDAPAAGVGVVTGLAWTAMGGAILDIEATLVHTLHRGFRLTGNLGEVMKESAEIAYSFVAANLERFQGDPAFFDEAHVHLHVPEGATPKDGPSAGISMASALLSLARGRRIRPRRLAMTGELTLTGRVLPVGGIREKVVAARRTRLTQVILPEGNRRDFDELPRHLRSGLTVHYASHFKHVFAILFP